MVVDKLDTKTAINAAHKRNLKITGHLCAVTYHEAAEMGIDNLEHGFMASTDFVFNRNEDECPPANILNQSLANLNIQNDSGGETIDSVLDRPESGHYFYPGSV